MQQVNIFWFRRDLRLNDNAGLYYALKSDLPVVPIFIFDKVILDDLENKHDPRVCFIYDEIKSLQLLLEKNGASLEVFYDEPEKVFQLLLDKYRIVKLFTNEDYEPYAIKRDTSISHLLKTQGAEFKVYKDQVIFHKDEILKDDGKPFTVFTPYSRHWKNRLNNFYLKEYPVAKYSNNFFKQEPLSIPTLKSMGFSPSGQHFPGRDIPANILSAYSNTRDFPGLDGTSRMGIHLRFGTISIRTLATKALEHNATYLNELIWRDFYFMILWQFPHVGQHKAFKEAYDNIRWRNKEEEFRKWCVGETGYPIVDAGMRQLNATGFMHNRVRMVTASFLSKHLLIDWRWGEAYFAEKLLDYDLAANNGGWQWAVGCGCDAAPYFRIFNPYLQTKRFDKDLKYIKKWVPEFDNDTYPPAIVEHDFARKRCLEVYSKALNEAR